MDRVFSARIDDAVYKKINDLSNYIISQGETDEEHAAFCTVGTTLTRRLIDGIFNDIYNNLEADNEKKERYMEKATKVVESIMKSIKVEEVKK